MNVSAAEPKMTLMEHLGELRARLFKIVIGVLLLGGASLFFSRELFGLLMRPVLQALPEASQSLVYTSAIEEVNVLLKIGLYSGLFLSTPLVLWQAWGFVAPGLYDREKKYAGPFIFFGTVTFVVGAAFCYLLVLPSMFQLLLESESAAALQQRIAVAQLREQDMLRFVRAGDLARAGEVGRTILGDLIGPGDGQVPPVWMTEVSPTSSEVRGSLEAVGVLLDALQIGDPANASLARAAEHRLAGVGAWGRGDLQRSQREVAQAAVAAGQTFERQSLAIRDTWEALRGLSYARGYDRSVHWTRPMLSMTEQLTLVLMLELAFGIIFELPLVMLLLSLLGLVSSKFFFKYQRHAIVVCLILAAVVTPTGDAINLSLMAGPLILCYELGVLLVWLTERARTKASAVSQVP